MRRLFRWLSDVRLLKQLILTFSVILAVNVIIGIYFTTKIAGLKTLVEVMYDNPLMASTYAVSAKHRFEIVDSLVRTSIFIKDQKKIDEFKKEIESQIEQGEEDLVVVQERAIAETSKDLALLVQSKVSTFKEVVDQTIRKAEKRASNRASIAVDIDLLNEYLAFDTRKLIQKKLTELTDDAAETGYAFRVDSELRNKETVRFFYIASAVMLLITLLLAFFLSRTIATPIASYSKTCLEISGGDYNKRVSVYGTESEIAVLGRSFNLMVDRVEEKDRNMNSLLNGLSTAVFSFNQVGKISKEKSIACKTVFNGYAFTEIFNFFSDQAGLPSEGIKDSIQVLWDPTITVDFESLVAGVFPSLLTLPLGSKEPEKFISLKYKPNHSSDGKLENIIVLADDITEATMAQKNSILQSERVDRIAKASLNAENYLESKSNFLSLIKYSTQLLEMKASQLIAPQLADLRRQLHSLKGELAIMGHRSCAKQVHAIESALADPLNSSVDAQLLEQIAKVEFSFQSEALDVLKVLGIDQQNKSFKVSSLKIHSLEDFVNSNNQYSSVEIAELRNLVGSLSQRPLEDYFQKYHDYVAGLAENLGKFVKLEFDPSGDEVSYGEVQSLDFVFGHLLRNCVDHGIEDPETREENSKDMTGVITILARRKPNDKCLEITLKDDGRGIDHRILVQKALDKKIWTPEQVRNATVSEALDLIFMSDFSTKDVVTETSGRGVGMDAVKSEIIARGGSIAIVTDVGVGTSFTICLPLDV